MNEQTLPYRVSEAAGLLDAQGNMRGTVFGEMSALAAQHGAINVGQGAPSSPTPDFLIDDVSHFMHAGMNQYAPPTGVPELLDAIVAQRSRRYNHTVTRDHVLVTVGATEALTSAIMALVPAGGVLLTFEPFYDSYAAACEMAGARLVTVPLVFNDGVWQPDWDAFDAAVSSADAVLLNTPHNPTGMVLGRDDLVRVFQACEDADAWLITDEVYEYLVFDPAEHVSVAALFPDSPRIVTVSSAGKTFNVTGWKIGWLVAHPQVRQQIQALKQFFSYTSGTPLQPAIAQALNEHEDFADQNRAALKRCRDLLMESLKHVPGITFNVPAAGYFTVVDFAEVTTRDSHALNELLTTEFGFTGIPVNRLCRAGSPVAQRLEHALRLSFCKTEDEMREVATRIDRLAQNIDALK